MASSSADGGPLKKTESYSASKSAMAAIFGPDHRYSQKNNGNETVQEEASGSGSNGAVSGQEPPSGIKGKGTVDEPYDQGNAPAQISSAGEPAVNGAKSGVEPVSGVKGKGTADEPYDQGNAGETTAGSQPVNTNSTTTTTTTTTTTAASAPAPAAASTNGTSAKSPEPQTESRGRTLAPPSSNDRYERSVSPGTLDDGTHEQCSGEKGGSYTPSTGLRGFANKLRNK